MKSFKELDFNMTFIYPANFVPAKAGITAPATYTIPATKPDKPPCVQTPLSVGSNAADNSALVFSIIDAGSRTVDLNVFDVSLFSALRRQT